MSGIIDKAMNFLGFEVQPEPPFSEQGEPQTTPHRDERLTKNNKPGKVININTTARLNVVVLSPETFEEARDIADHLKAKKPCVVNLESVDKEVSRRIVDFLSGSVYALDGNIQKISAGIFLIAPYNVSILGDFKDELRNKGVFPWNT